MRESKNYTNEQFTEAVKNSFSLAELMRKLNIRDAGGNYSHVKKRIKFLNLSTSHFTGAAHLRGKTHNYNPPIPLANVLVENCDYNRVKLKERLIEVNLLSNICYLCATPNSWQGSELVLHLDHINGVSNDNRIENLRLLCPNCHSQTDTYCGKNKAKKNRANGIFPLNGKEKREANKKSTHRLKNCDDCGISVYMKSDRCKACDLHYRKLTKATLKLHTHSHKFDNYERLVKLLETNPQEAIGIISAFHVSRHDPRPNSRKVERPSKEELAKLVWEMPSSKLGKQLGVSDKAIEKWCKLYGITKPERGYWAKLAADNRDKI